MHLSSSELEYLGSWWFDRHQTIINLDNFNITRRKKAAFNIEGPQ